MHTFCYLGAESPTKQGAFEALLAESLIKRCGQRATPPPVEVMLLSDLVKYKENKEN